MILERLADAGVRPREHISKFSGPATRFRVCRSPRTPGLGTSCFGVSAADPSRGVLDRFVREFAPLVTAGPPGVTGYTGGRVEAASRARLLAHDRFAAARHASRRSAHGRRMGGDEWSEQMTGLIRLGEIAHARSGDKGNHANIGVIAFREEDFRHLGQVLTEARVAEYFLPLRPSEVRALRVARRSCL